MTLPILRDSRILLGSTGESPAFSSPFEILEARLGRDTLHAQLPEGLARAFESLRGETDAELRDEQFLTWADRVEREGRPDIAGAALAALADSPASAASQRDRAHERLEVLQGRGSWGQRLAHQVPVLTRELFSPASILSMAAGGAVFRLTRWAMLGRLSALPVGILTRGRSAVALANAAGFLLEAPAFTLSSQALRGQLGEAPLGSELLRSYVSLGGLRLGGISAQGLQRGLGLSANSALTPVFAQSGMFGGIWLGGVAEERLRLHPERRAADRLFDSLVMLGHFNLGGRIAQEVMGPNYRAWESSMDRNSAALTQSLERPRSPLQGLSSPWLAPMWMAMGAGGLGGFGVRRRVAGNQLSLPFSASSRPTSAAPRFSAPDLAQVEGLRRASTQEFSRTLTQLQGRGELVAERDQVSYIRHFRLAGGIERLGDIFRAQGADSMAALEALHELAAEHRPAVLRELSRALQSSHVLGAVQAIEAMSTLRGVELLPELQALPRSPVSALSAAAEAARLDLGDATLLPELQARAADRRQPDIDRVAALEALGRHGDRDSAIEELRCYFRHFHSHDVQTRAALALTRLGANAAILSFESRLERSSPRERADYAAAFFDLNSDFQALPIWNALAGGGSESRRFALELAARTPRAEMMPALERMLDDAYPEIRIEAGRRLASLAASTGNISILEGLLTRVEASSLRQSEALQIQAATALLARGPHDAARERLHSYLGSSFGESRLEAAVALLNHGEATAAGPTIESLSGAEQASLRHRAAAALIGHQSRVNGGGRGFRPGLGLLGIGALSWLLHPSLAEASTGSSHGGNSWWLPLVLFGGGVAMAVARHGEVAGAGSVPREETVSWFENPHDSNESYVLPQVGETSVALGRSTERVPNIFSSHYRSISRRHAELRTLNGELQIRGLEGRALRINNENFDSAGWHSLRDNDIVEFVGEGNADISGYLVDAHGQQTEAPGAVVIRRGRNLVHLVPGTIRLGRNPVEVSDMAPIFRFRQARRPLTPPPPPPETSVAAPAVAPDLPSRLLQRLADLFTRRPSEPPAVAPESAQPAAPPPGRPAPASSTRAPSQVHAEIARLAATLDAPIAMLEQGTPMSDFHSRRSRTSILDGLLRIHRQFCGNETRSISVAIRHSESGEYQEHPYEVPDWEGALTHRLSALELEIADFRSQPGGEILQARARSELGKARDHANRLLEMVRRLRHHFERLEPHEAALFDAIEGAYRGFRNEGPANGQRVRSLSRGLNADVEPNQRERWIEEFSNRATSSRTMVNARILSGDIREVHGLPVAGSFYAALSGGTLYEGRRSVLFYYDRRGGQILGFEDGRPATREAMARFERSEIEVAEGRIRVEPEGHGRIVEVQFNDEAPREAIAEGLQGLINLRVLPPQSLLAWNGHAGDPDLRLYQLQLAPAVESPRENWYQIVGLVRRFQGDQSLLTVEAMHSNGPPQGLQLIVPEIDTLGMRVDDVLTVREHSSLESQP